MRWVSGELAVACPMERMMTMHDILEVYAIEAVIASIAIILTFVHFSKLIKNVERTKRNPDYNLIIQSPFGRH